MRTESDNTFTIMPSESSKIIRGVDKKREYSGVAAVDGEIAVFDPTQIKSATGNRGTFDGSDPRIDYAERQLPVQKESIAFAYEFIFRVGKDELEKNNQYLARTKAKRFGFCYFLQTNEPLEPLIDDPGPYVDESKPPPSGGN